MKIKMNSILLTVGVLIASASSALAGSESHGGKGIACKNGTTVTLLDYFETAQTTTYNIDLGPNQGNYLDRVNYVLNRLSKIDPVSAARFSARAATFESERKFVAEAVIKTIADSNDAVNPPAGCTEEQFAVQVFNLKPGQARYLINQDLWNAADDVNRAGLVLHEIILTDAVNEFSQQNSDNTRYYNGFISSDAMNSVSPSAYLSVIQAADFEESKTKCLISLVTHGIPVCTGNRSGLEESVAYDFILKLADGQTVNLNSGDYLYGVNSDSDNVPILPYRGPESNASPQFTFTELGQQMAAWSFSIDKNNHLISIDAVKGSVPTSIGTFNFDQTNFPIGLGIGLYPDGKVRSIENDVYHSPFSTTLNGCQTQLGSMEFYHSGSLRQAEVAQLVPVNGKCLSVKYGSNLVQFYEDGKVTDAVLAKNQTVTTADGSQLLLPSSILGDGGVDHFYYTIFNEAGQAVYIWDESSTGNLVYPKGTMLSVSSVSAKENIDHLGYQLIAHAYVPQQCMASVSANNLKIIETSFDRQDRFEVVIPSGLCTSNQNLQAMDIDFGSITSKNTSILFNGITAIAQ